MPSEAVPLTRATASDNSVAATGNPYLDTLIVGDKWNKDHAVTFYFDDRDEPETAWIEEGKDAVRNALAAYENYIDLEFDEVDNADDANFVIGMYSAPEVGGNDVIARFGFPTADDDRALGKFRWDWGRWTPEHLQVGGFAFGATVLHELGHGLGLAHTHGTEGLSGEPFPGVSVDGYLDPGDNGQNSLIYSVMSYDDSDALWAPLPLSSDYGWGFPATPMAFDVAALQHIYGANTSYKSGNSTWTLPATNGVGTYWTTIWDPSGVDTMRHLGNAPAHLDLREAPLEGEDAGGYLSRVDGIAGGFVVAHGAKIENAEGGGGNDRIWGNDWANVLDGNGGADTIDGLGGADTIDGDGGNDNLFGWDGADDVNGGYGDDYLEGGNGNDDLDGGGGNDWLRGGANDDILRGGAGNDTLLAEAGHDDLRGGTGNDSLWADAGNDVLQGGAGNDYLEGGPGVDIADYFGAAGAVNVDLEILVGQAVGGVDAGGLLAGGNGDAGDGEGVDTLFGIENLGGSNGFGDTLRGNDSSNRLYGVGGNDVLEGRGGSDILDGGMGSDTASYASADIGVSVNLSNALPQNTLGAGIDSFISIENLNGSAHNDILVGDAQTNTLQGAAGDDWLLGGAGADGLYGGAGNDLMSGGAGNDTLSGSSGVDVASYLTSAAGVTVSLALAGYQNTVGAGSDRLIGVENLHGSGFDDTLTGSATGNKILGGAGDDAIAAGDGNDTLGGGLGDDILDGGDGVDTADYSAAAGPITIDLKIVGAQDTGEGLDTLAGIEHLIGSAFDDAFIGNYFVNRFDGGGGADDLRGWTGNDTVNGDAGDDYLVGDGGDDVVDGGAGDDRPFGGTGVDILNGGDGIDTLIGGPDADRMDGGDGQDRLFGDTSADIFVFAAGTGDRVFGFETGLHKLEFDISAFGGAAGAFAFVANANPVAVSAQQTFLYDDDGGFLYFDPDGNGATPLQYLITLMAAPTLAAGDIVLV